jgi:hypothetical protein
MEEIITIIYKLIWGILGGAISIAFVVGAVGALVYMVYYLIKYGWRAFEGEFITRP